MNTYWDAAQLGFRPMTFATSKVNPSIEVTVPHYFDGLFRPTYYRTGGAAQPQLSVRSTLTGLGAAGTGRVTHLVLKAGGDDFTLVGFRGIPVMTF